MTELQLAYAELKANRNYLTRQQMKTLKGQLRSGQVLAAMKGLDKILRRKGV